jgi:OmpA-OmpF porin, OOP family
MRSRLDLSLAVAGLATLAVAASAQNVRDLTGHEPTSQELIDTLKPTHQTRGIGTAPAGGKPQCAALKTTTRGLGPAPVSDAVAVHVVFATNSAQLSPQAMKTLGELGKALSSSDLKAYCFVVEGHTDSVGSEAHNLALSERRAQSVVRYLEDTFHIDSERLQAVGYGKQKPIADNGTEEGRQKNRRVQIANLGG